MGGRQLIDRTEFVRVIQQGLHRLGYPEAAQRLQDESVSPVYPSAYLQHGPSCAEPPQKGCLPCTLSPASKFIALHCPTLAASLATFLPVSICQACPQPSCRGLHKICQEHL